MVDIVFGSKSDSWYYEKIPEYLKEESKIHVFSAHRNILDIKDFVSILKGDLIIAGAGLSAALPGVLAGATQKPVIGIPICKNTDNNCPGIDSIYSMFSMPKGISVLVMPLQTSKKNNLNLLQNLNEIENHISVIEYEDLDQVYHILYCSMNFCINSYENKNLWLERWKNERK